MASSPHNFDDERIKLEVLEMRVENLVSILAEMADGENIPELMYVLALATYDLALAQIEAYYWQHPHLACRLRVFVTAVLQEGSHQLEDDNMIFNAIRNGIAAEQLESLLEELE